VVADPDALRRAARVLEEVTLARRHLVVSAQDGWRGRHRSAFDEDDAVLRRRADELTERLYLAAAAATIELRASTCAPR
jgi:hypothetical protein